METGKFHYTDDREKNAQRRKGNNYDDDVPTWKYLIIIVLVLMLFIFLIAP